VVRHAAYVASIAACVWLSVASWYAGFAPGQSGAFPVFGFLFALAAVILTFLWRIPSA
jgi:hypothetical protein